MVHFFSGYSRVRTRPRKGPDLQVLNLFIQYVYYVGFHRQLLLFWLTARLKPLRSLGMTLEAHCSQTFPCIYSYAMSSFAWSLVFYKNFNMCRSQLQGLLKYQHICSNITFSENDHKLYAFSGNMNRFQLGFNPVAPLLVTFTYSTLSPVLVPFIDSEKLQLCTEEETATSKMWYLFSNSFNFWLAMCVNKRAPYPSSLKNINELVPST